MSHGSLSPSPPSIQTLFTPLGLSKPSENGLFITPLRIIPTTLLKDKFEHKISFINPDLINHSTKKANFSALEYFLDIKIPEIKKGLLKSLMCEYLNRDYIFDWEFEKIPIPVINKYNNTLISYKNKCYLEYSKRRFQEYLFKLESERRYIRISNKTTGEKDLKFLETRYCDSYCKKIKKRMSYLSARYKDRPSVLLSLTMDPKKFGNDKLYMAQIFNKEVNRFLEALRILFKREGRVFPKFIASTEFQKNGNPHKHIVFLGASRIIDWRKIRDLWGNGFIYINRTSKNEKIRYPISYITKYITKTFANYNYENSLTQSLVWLNGLRSYSCSNGIVAPINPKGSGAWSLDYLVVCDRRNSAIDEMNIIQDRESVMLNPQLWANPPPKCKGKYIIYADGDEVISTDSPFWSDFFT